MGNDEVVDDDIGIFLHFGNIERVYLFGIGRVECCRRVVAYKRTFEVEILVFAR